MSTGAKSGQPRRAILTFTRDADDHIVAGTKSGSHRSRLRANLRPSDRDVETAGERCREGGVRR
jgi:hypothetical protein